MDRGPVAERQKGKIKKKKKSKFISFLTNGLSCTKWIYCTYIYKIVEKGQFVPVRAMKAYRENRGITLLILNIGITWMWVVNFMPRALCPQGKNDGTQWREGWMDPTASLDVLEREKSLAPAGFRAPVRSVRILVTVIGYMWYMHIECVCDAVNRRILWWQKHSDNTTDTKHNSEVVPSTWW
jgi:hypothetical protein